MIKVDFFVYFMNKKTTTIIIIAVVVLIVAVGGWYGYKKYREQRLWSAYCEQLGLPKEVCKNMGGQYPGGNYPGTTPVTGTPSSTAEGESADDIFNQATNMTAQTDLTKASEAIIRPSLEKVFGGAKLTSFFYNYASLGWDLVGYVVKKVPQGADANALVADFQAKGLTIDQTAVNGNYFSLVVTKDSVTYSLTYNGEGQEVEVMINKMEE